MSVRLSHSLACASHIYKHIYNIYIYTLGIYVYIYNKAARGCAHARSLANHQLITRNVCILQCVEPTLPPPLRFSRVHLLLPRARVSLSDCLHLIHVYIIYTHMKKHYRIALYSYLSFL